MQVSRRLRNQTVELLRAVADVTLNTKDDFPAIVAAKALDIDFDSKAWHLAFAIRLKLFPGISLVRPPSRRKRRMARAFEALEGAAILEEGRCADGWL
jgi:hypothetical protein